MYAKIEPVTYRVGEAGCLVIRSISVQLNERAIIEWSLMTDPVSGLRKDFESGGTQLTGEDYSAWSNDDQYVYTWLATQLQLTVLSMEAGSYWG